MEKVGFLTDLDALTKKLESLESGDLIAISDIKNSYEEIKNHLGSIITGDQLILNTDFLPILTEKLSDSRHESEIKTILIKANQYLADYLNKPESFSEIQVNWEKLIHDFKSIIEDGKEAEILKTADELINQYEGFFNNIVDDSKMLSQLCEEIREHLDTAQYTLVELEFNETNQENINKVFRSFHTIKGSSAFLGLKNIEEIGHEMESLLVLVRDGKLRVSRELIDVIFMGIELLRSLISIMETNQFQLEKMTRSFVKVDIFSYMKLIKKIIAEYPTKKIGEILAEGYIIFNRDVETILSKQKESGKKFGEIAVEEKLVSEKDLLNALKKQQTITAKSTSYVKVSNERLNSLIDIVGELVINQSMIKQVLLHGEASSDSSERALSQLEFITTTIKNLVLSMGMVPISEIFNKLRVVVRNTSQETGKTVVVDLKGEETELDRNVIEAIYDPLVHMVRNSIDHGIEPPEEREQLNKDRIGKIVITAEHKGNNIEISVFDDGRGIDRDAVLKKAISENLVDLMNIENISDREVYNLMFLPGFSTTRKVTEISGRGVGLDVVKRNIESIRGRIDVTSQPGQFTKFTIKLPLTLAIIEGFVTMIGKNKYVLPFTSIDEIVVPLAENLKIMDDGNIILLNRGAYVPLLFAGKILNEVGFNQDISSLLLVLISFDSMSYAIVVDRIIGKQEIVIKSMGEVFSGLSAFSGGTIFGDGTIGFVVDIEGLLKGVKKLQGA